MTHSDSTTTPDIKEPKTSVPLLVALALLGYVYIFMLMVALLVAALAIVFFMLKFHHLWFAKFAFLLVITAGLMVKALFVRFPEPQGLVIDPGYAPRLDELVADLRSKTGCPKIHSVLLNGEFNCGITQIPRLGILGWHKNILLLGLPLLDAVSIDEFKAVLAHEMGHISGKHGVVSCWIYQVQKSWDQLYEILRAENALGSFLLQIFANWYEPLFAKRSLALCREHELAADQLSVNIVGGQTTCNALIRTEVVGTHLSKKISDTLRRSVVDHPEPFRDLYHYLRVEVASKLDESQIQTTLLRAWKAHKEFDTHPSLSERLKAIQPSGDWSNVDTVTKDFISLEPIAETPAEFFFDQRIVEIRQQLCDEWYEKKLAGWQADFQQLQKLKAELLSLQEVAGRGELDGARASKMASLISEVQQDDDQAIAQLRSLLASFPNEAGVSFHLGVVLLSVENDEGVALVEKAIALDETFSYAGYISIYTFFGKVGRDGEADIYFKRLQDYLKKLQKGQVKPPQTGDFTPPADSAIGSQTASKSTSWTQRILNWKSLVLGVGVIAAFAIFQSELHKTPEQGTPVQHHGMRYHDMRDYMQDLTLQLQRHWRMPLGVHAPRSARLRFEVDRDGNVSDVKVERSSGKEAADQAARAALYHSSPLPPPPEENGVTITYTFVDPNAQYTDINEYMEDLQVGLKSRWIPPKSDKSLSTVVLFKVLKNGTISNLKIDHSSGNKEMDQAALNAVQQSVPFATPPTEDNSADIQFTFDYNVFSSKNKNRPE